MKPHLDISSDQTAGGGSDKVEAGNQYQTNNQSVGASSVWTAVVVLVVVASVAVAAVLVMAPDAIMQIIK